MSGSEVAVDYRELCRPMQARQQGKSSAANQHLCRFCKGTGLPIRDLYFMTMQESCVWKTTGEVISTPRREQKTETKTYSNERSWVEQRWFEESSSVDWVKLK